MILLSSSEAESAILGGSFSFRRLGIPAQSHVRPPAPSKCQSRNLVPAKCGPLFWGEVLRQRLDLWRQSVTGANKLLKGLDELVTSR